jgi:hypothetical protein
MKKHTKQKQSRMKPFLVTLLCALVALLAAVGAYKLMHRNDQNNTQDTGTINYGPATDEDKKAVDEHKEELAKEQAENKDTNPGDGGSSNPGTTAPDTKITVTIVRASQTSAGQALNIRTIVDGVTSGTCEVTLTKGGQPTINKTFQVGFEATSASCDNADIPASAFSVGGDWNLSVIAKKDSAQSNAATQVATITK